MHVMRMVKTTEESSKKWNLILSRTERLLTAIIGDVIGMLDWGKIVGRIILPLKSKFTFHFVGYHRIFI